MAAPYLRLQVFEAHPSVSSKIQLKHAYAASPGRASRWFCLTCGRLHALTGLELQAVSRLRPQLSSKTPAQKASGYAA